MFGTRPGSRSIGGGGATYSVAASGARPDVARGDRSWRSNVNPVDPPPAIQVTPRASATNWIRRASTSAVGSSAVNAFESSKAPISGTRTICTLTDGRASVLGRHTLVHTRSWLSWDRFHPAATAAAAAAFPPRLAASEAASGSVTSTSLSTVMPNRVMPSVVSSSWAGEGRTYLPPPCPRRSSAASSASCPR